jgi:hypothetical protein
MERTPIRRAELGHGITLGSQPICAREPYDRRIHIWTPGEACKCIPFDSSDLALPVHNRKKFGLPIIQKIYDFAKGDGKLLIHCGAGMHRSPTAAVIALHARGIPVWDAMSIVVRGTWHYDDDPIMPWFDFDMMEEIRNWAVR